MRSKTAHESFGLLFLDTDLEHLPVDNTARTELNSLVISVEWLEDSVLQFWCSKIHWGLRKTGPPVTALFVCCMEYEARRAPMVLQILAMAAR
jgi:hypothetical protein